MRIDLLGPIQVGEESSALEPRDRIALSVLAIRRNQIVSPDQLADALWPIDPPSSWAKQVQICISRLRKTLGPDTIATLPGGYQLILDELDIDVGQFEQLVARGHVFFAEGESDRAAASFARALALWRGNPFEEVDAWARGKAEASRLLELRRTTQEDWLEARLAAGDHAQVAVDALPLVSEEPLRERRWRILALSQYRSGRQADALRSISTARETLRDELGLDPGPELVDLEDAILRQDEALAPTSIHVVVNAACPYKGLAPYDQDDGDEFFGRDDEITLIADRLRTSPLVVLSGPSGCGKSSLAKAGLAHAFKARGRPAVVFVPGRDPSSAMTEAIASSSPKPIVVVDQLEEMFALDVPLEEVKAFCTRVAAYANGQAPVILVVRSDYLGALAISPELSRLAEQGLHLVTPLAGEPLRRAIEQPATRAGLRLEHGLVELLERDTEGEPGALPLLSHALSETWRRRDGNVMTVEGYRSTGGIRGAVAHSADRLYDSLPDGQRAVLRSLLLRMVSPSIDGPPVRCRVPMRNMTGDPDRDRVVALLVRSRLVTAEEDSYELAHEALARAWPRLKSWLDDDADGQRMMRHLAARADDWDSLGRPESELYRGARLELVLDWQEQGAPDLNDSEKAFLAASIHRAEAEGEEAAARVRQDVRQNKMLKALLVAAGIFLVAAVFGALMATQGRQEARLEALEGQSLALRSTNRTVAALLAVEASRRNADAGSWSALLGTFTAAPEFLGYQYLSEAESLSGTLIPGTNDAVVALSNEDLRLFDMTTGAVADVFTGTSSEASWGSRLKVSNDGAYVAQYSARETDLDCFSLESLERRDDEGCAVLQVFNLSTGAPVMNSVSPPIGLGELAINSDGSLIAITGGFDGDLAVYRTSDGRLIGRVDGIPRPTGLRGLETIEADYRFSVQRGAGVAFGTDGLLYLGSMAGPVRSIDPETLEVTKTFEAPVLSSNNFVIATDDVLYVAGTQALAAFQLPDGAPLWTADLRQGRHPEPCPWFEVNPIEGELYCGTFFGVIEIRSLASGALTGELVDPQLGSVGDIDVTSDGKVLAVFGADTPTVSRWIFDGSGLVTKLVAEGHVSFDGYNTAGDSLLVAVRGPEQARWDEFSDFAVWDPTRDAARAALPIPLEGVGWLGPDDVTGYYAAENRILAFDVDSMTEIPEVELPTTSVNIFTSAGGQFIYVTFSGGHIWRIDPDGYTRLQPTTAIVGKPISATATRNGERLVVSAVNHGSSFIDVYDGETGEHLAGPQEGPLWSAVSLDGIVVGARGGEITEYDLETLEPVGTFPGARGEVNALQFSADGKVLFASANDQTVSIYDVATRRRIGDVIPTFSPHIGPGNLRPDGMAVAVNQRNGVVIWDIDPQHLAEAACILAGRNLTQSEWRTYMSGFGAYRSTCPQYG